MVHLLISRSSLFYIVGSASAASCFGGATLEICAEKGASVGCTLLWVFISCLFALVHPARLFYERCEFDHDWPSDFAAPRRHDILGPTLVVLLVIVRQRIDGFPLLQIRFESL